MNITGSIALDAFSILYMLILILNLGHKNKKDTLDFQYFWIMVMVCIFLGLDLVYFTLYGHSDALGRILLKIVKSVYFIVNCAIILLWANYIDYTIFGNINKYRGHRYVYTAVFLLNTFAVVINFFTGFLFEISSEGTFLVKALPMWIFTLLNYMTVILVTMIIIQNKKTIKSSIFYPLVLFPFPPLCAEILQIFYRPISLVCTYSLSALIVFQISQENVIFTDEMTGLANRRMLNESLSKWFSDPKGTYIHGVMIDLDGLKRINDTYGHLAGDHAIIHMAEIIKEIDRKEMIAARYGGDEFVLAWLSDDDQSVSAVLQTLETTKNDLNPSWPESERIDFSVGAFSCHDSDPWTADDFLKEIDNNMYHAKKAKKKHRVHENQSL